MQLRKVMFDKLIFALLFNLSLSSVQASGNPVLIAEELLGAGGNSTGMAQGGVASESGSEAIRNNPANVALSKQYMLFGEYNWGRFGREFYQGAIIDSSTSKYSAGLSYTGFMDPYDNNSEQKFHEQNSQEGLPPPRELDFPLDKRITVALAKQMGAILVGVQLNHIKSFSQRGVIEDAKVDNYTNFGLGISGAVSNTLRYGLATENFSAKELNPMVAKVYKAGVSYLLSGLSTLINLDYRRTMTVDLNEYQSGSDYDTITDQGLILSMNFRSKDGIQLLGGLGRYQDGRSSGSLGIVLGNEQMGLAYMYSAPNLSESGSHQSLQLQAQMAM